MNPIQPLKKFKDLRIYFWDKKRKASCGTVHIYDPIYLKIEFVLYVYSYGDVWKGTTWMYTKLWAMGHDGMQWRKVSLFTLILVDHLSFVQWDGSIYTFVIKKRKRGKCKSQQEMQMASKHMKRWSSSSIIKEKKDKFCLTDKIIKDSGLVGV